MEETKREETCLDVISGETLHPYTRIRNSGNKKLSREFFDPAMGFFEPRLYKYIFLFVLACAFFVPLHIFPFHNMKTHIPTRTAASERY